MEFHLVWLLLFLPIFIHSTDPQSSTERFNPEWQHPQDAPEEPVQSSPPPDPTLLLLEVPKVEEPAPVNLDPIVVKNVESDSVSSSSGIPEKSSNDKILEAGKKESKTEEIPEGEHEVESQIPATPSHVDGEEKTEEEELLSEERDNSQVPLADYSPPPATMEPFVLLDAAEGGDGDKTEGRKDDEDNKTAAKTEEIPSFSEWTKLQLLNKKQDAVLLQPNGAVNNKKEDGKNFASPDCGAKVLLANPEAQNPSGLLSSSHDEYMLNRCGVSSWIIMELCERIRIEKIAMGNLELFSSSPKEVEVGVSDRFPTREWARVGPLELPDTRAVHSFPISGNYSYNKFVRVQILSHHGNEHYCPLSLIRVYGKSEYEEVLHEVTHADEDHLNHPESPLDEGTPIMEGTNQKSVIGSAADAVMNIVKKAVNVLGKRDNGDSSSGSTCQSITDCISTQPSQANVTEVCNWKDVSFVLDHSRYFNKEIINCHLLFQNYSIGAPGTVEGFWRAAFGEAILFTACNYETPTRNCSEPEPQVEAEQMEIDNGIKSNATIESNLTNSLTPPALSVKPTTENIQSTLDPNISTEPKQSTLAPLIVVEEEAKTVQKESVFVRLTNKIKNLERNQSLSSGYLEELSQRFKKQSEESYSVSQGMKKNLNETLGKYKWLQEFTRRESSYLRRSVSDLRVTLWRTEMQRGFLILVAFAQFVGISLFCCWTRKKLSQLEDKLNSQTSNTNRPVQLSRAGDQSESHPIIPRKRSNSHPELLKSKKKKKKKENSLKNSENIFTFIPQSVTAPANLGLKNLSASNGILTNSNQLSLSPTTEFLVPYAPGSTPNSINRFGILASPSVKTVHSLGGVSSSSADTIAVAPIETVTNGNRSGGSAGSLDSGSSTSTKSSKQKKKMKFKNFIPKLFEK